DHVCAGKKCRLTVRVDNRLSFQTIPPGIIVDSPEGPKQKFWLDFFNYAGIHRDVWLCRRPQAHIEDVTITTDIDGNDGIVTWSVL
ncbi:beta-glucuronidase, partial [[Clostridium] scindens]|nr:beta-glucuronidase [[Clostridium] scindens]